MSHRTRSSCRGCGGGRVRLFLSLGSMPLANAFLKSPEECASEPTYPLDVYFCEECALVQLLDVVDREVLFSNYIYVTGTSDTMAAHNAEYAGTVAEVAGLRDGDLVVEIGSNDGSLLKCFKRHGVRAVGIEPARNIAELAAGAGVETLNVFFDWPGARMVREKLGPAQVVIANNVLAHVDETSEFLRGCGHLLGEGGVVVIEVPYLAELLERVEYDTIYHEHLCYFSMVALCHLFEAVGLAIVRVDRVDVHGGSLRLYAARGSAGHSKEAVALAEREAADGLDGIARYERFATEVRRNRAEVRRLLLDLTGQGRTIAGYGAPAKGNTLLNYCRIDTSLLPYTVDRNPMKVGLYTPGMHIPVLSVEALRDRRPDYAMILAWNFADEIMRQQRAFREGGGHFIVPIPRPVIL